MKRISFAALLLLITSTVTFAQRIMKVEKTDGTTVEYPVTEVTRVYFEEIVHPDLALSTTTLSLKAGEASTVEITAGSCNYTVVSDQPSVATAELEGSTITVAGVAVGTAAITVTDTQSGQTATIAVTVTAADNSTIDAVAVDLGLPSGSLWADRNVGASCPEDYGGYYAWGETEEKGVYNWDTYLYGYYNDDGDYSHLVNIGTDIAGTDYDVAHVKWGGSWKMPTRDQVRELFENCTHEWTTVNGINGRRFTSKINGNSIFLPAAGNRWDSDLGGAGSGGYYWSSALGESYPLYACLLSFVSSYAYWYGSGYRLYGRSVRPVR